MAIQSILRDWADGVSIVRIVTTDTLAVVGTAGYITAQGPNILILNAGPFQWTLSDMVLVWSSALTGGGWGFYTISADFTSLNAFAFSTTLVGGPAVVGDFSTFASAGGNLEDLGYKPSNPAYTSVTMSNTPTVINQIPIFNDVNGSITDSGMSIANGLLEQTAVSGLTAHSGGGQAGALALTNGVNNITVVAAAGDSVRLPASAPGMEITVTNSGANSMQVYGAGTDTINGIATATGVAQLPGVTTVYTSAVAGNWLANVVSNPSPTQFASVPITAAQFNAMSVTPIQLVAAPGVNKMISIDKIDLIMTYGTTAFAVGGVVAAQYGNTALGAGSNATNTEQASDFFATASTVYQFNGVSGNTVGAIPVANASNAGVFLSNTVAPFTTGNSTFIAKIYYRVINLVGAL
jgi:hypothetical protein